MMDKYIKPGLQSFYSAGQIQLYLQRINFGGTYPLHPNLKNLERLVRLHLLAFPFENSRLHYAATHEVDVSPDYVYDRLVEKRQGGSWCCGHNGLFLGMLRGLGYRTFAVSGRVNQSPPSEEARDFTFLSHLALIVQIDEESSESDAGRVLTDKTSETPKQETYLVDVGFGGTGIVRPMLLKVGHTMPGSSPPEEHRLVRGMHPESSLCDDESSRQWVLQYRCGSHQPNWSVLYVFDETETYPSDWIAYSQWLSTHPVERFLNNVICVRHFIVEGGAEQEEDGVSSMGRLVMMGRRVDRRVGAQSETIREFSNESERVRTLKEDFGITVDENEVQNIALTPAALSDSLPN